MSVVRIIATASQRPRTPPLLGCAIDVPSATTVSSTFDFGISGWVLGVDEPVDRVELTNQQEVLRALPVSRRRPDIAQNFPEVPHALVSGFQGRVGVTRLEPDFVLGLVAVFADGRRATLGSITGTRESCGGEFAPTLQPLLLTSLGRTGTTWFMHLLAHHPRIVAHRVYPYELRIAKYWLHLLGVLSEPADHIDSATVDTFSASPSWVGINPFNVDGTPFSTWLGTDHVRNLAAFCQRSTEECYQAIAEAQGKTDVRYFVEKANPDRIPWLVHDLYPDAKEIVLVRDFRDMLCSIFAFNAKRGFAAFGREQARSDEEYVWQIRESAVRLLESWRRRSQDALLIRYEDLVTNPHRALATTLGYLGLHSSKDAVQGVLDHAGADASELAQHRTTSDAIQSIGRWERDLPNELHAVAADALDDIVAEFGYETKSRAVASPE